MTVPVCLPFRPGEPSRDRVWAFLRPRWIAAGFDVYVGDNPEPRFSAAYARNQAATLAGEWDVALFVDADILLDPDAARAACETARETSGYTACYTLFHWLDQPVTEAVLAGHTPVRDDAADSQYGSWLCAFAIDRGLWDTLGGYNAVTWQGVGGEDIEFVHRVMGMVEPTRVEGDAFHLYHVPREERFT